MPLYFFILVGADVHGVSYAELSNQRADFKQATRIARKIDAEAKLSGEKPQRTEVIVEDRFGVRVS